MNINEKIAQLRALVNYDNSKDVRDTLVLPYDFKRAVEYAVRAMCKSAKIVMKSIFVPFVENNQRFLIQLESAGANGFESVAIHKIFIRTSDGSTIEITQDEIEGVLSDTTVMNLGLYRIALRSLETSISLQGNSLVGSQPAAGTFSSISAFPSASSITVSSGSFSSSYYVVNLSKANDNKYSYAKITGVAGSNLTLDQTIQTDSNYLWSVGDKIYVVQTLPYMASVLFQGLPKDKYFETYSTLPLNDVYLDYVDDIALVYLYKILKGRFPAEYARLYNDQLIIEKDKIREVKRIANMRMEYTIPKLYIPYPQDYGRD